jgi:catechol 2,3-dioxygenase-like lactoylglutathione lyase family enzyme
MHPARLYAPGPHVGLVVSDLERARDFYVNLLGFLWDSALELPAESFARLLRLPGATKLKAEYLWREGFCLEFLAYEGIATLPNPRAPENALGLSYLALEAGNLAETLRRLRAAGAEILEERLYPNAEAPQIVFVRDPDGELIQLVAQGLTGATIRGRRGWYPIKPHLKLVVSDLERSIRFYRDVLGFHYEDQGEIDGPDIARILGVPEARYRHALLWKAGFALLLRSFDTPPPAPGRGGPMNQLGFAQLALHVYDLPGAIAAARDFGVEVFEDTLVRRPGEDTPAAVYLRDPDGQLVEVIQV